jgi:hypothetical protein
VAINFEKRRILIWGKTAPELSAKYYETVCTGGVTDDGEPIRLYPIPLRYLSEGSQFKKYQWITVGVKQSDSDPRPESYKVAYDSLEIGESIPRMNLSGAPAATSYSRTRAGNSSQWRRSKLHRRVPVDHSASLRPGKY